MKQSDWAGIRILLFDWWDAATTGPVFLFLQSLSISGFKIKTNLAAPSKSIIYPLAPYLPPCNFLPVLLTLHGT